MLSVTILIQLCFLKMDILYFGTLCTIYHYHDSINSKNYFHFTDEAAKTQKAARDDTSRKWQSWNLKPNLTTNAMSLLLLSFISPMKAKLNSPGKGNDDL